MDAYIPQMKMSQRSDDWIIYGEDNENLRETRSEKKIVSLRKIRNRKEIVDNH